MTKDPVDLIKKDRHEARQNQDANADVCFLSLSTLDGKASVRTLVLRDIEENSFSIFINKSSPKWEILARGGSYQLLLWYPSVQRQYRISGEHDLLADDIVGSNWQKRPQASKYLDMIYEKIAPQSSLVDSRKTLLSHVKDVKSRYQTGDVETPTKAAGVKLIATRIEVLDLNQEDRIHDRQVYSRIGKEWTSATLIP